MSLDFIKNNPFGLALNIIMNSFNDVFNIITELSFGSYVFAIPMAMIIIFPSFKLLIRYILKILGVVNIYF